MAVCLLLLYQLTLPLQLRIEQSPPQTQPGGDRGLPVRVWLFAAVTLCYGAIEAAFGNWTPLYLENSAGLGMADAALGLSIFWAVVTLGRVLFALVAARLNVRLLFFVTPILVAIVFLLLPLAGGAAAHYLALLVAGLALSFFFPYSISLASAEFPARTAAVSGMLVAGIQLGSGISANAIGLLSESIGLSASFRSVWIVAVIMAGLVVYLGVSRQAGEHRGPSDLNQSLPCQPAPCPQVYNKETSVS